MSDQINPSIFDELEKEKLFFEYASTGQRLANLLIDSVAFFCAYIVLAILFSSLGVDFEDLRISDGTFILGWIIYYSLQEGLLKGKTLGKLITRTRAVKEDGGTLTFKDAFVRSLIRLVPFEAVSGFGGNFWHDKWSKTMVVKNRQQP